VTASTEGRRGQLSLPAVEALLGALLLVGVTAGFVLGADVGDDPAVEAQLDRYANDAAHLLATEPAASGNGTRLAALAASNASFTNERGPTRRQLDAAFPANVAFRVRTPAGTVGYPPPNGTTGTARRATGDGTVVVEVWFV
jgi:hypothetical protein